MINLIFENYYFIFAILFVIGVRNLISDIEDMTVYGSELIGLTVFFSVLRIMSKPEILTSLVTGFIIILAVYRLLQFVKKDSIGEGDIFYLMLLNSLMTIKDVYFIYALANITGLVFLLPDILLKKLNCSERIAFVPFIFCGQTLYFISLI